MSITEDLTWLEKIADPVDRAVAAHGEMARVNTLGLKLAALRGAAITEALGDGRDRGEVGEKLGVSRQRVHQLAAKG